LTYGDSFIIDIIGHVVEKNDMKETEKNGKISKLMDAALEDLELVYILYIACHISLYII
jgi:hypothetical protein